MNGAGAIRENYSSGISTAGDAAIVEVQHVHKSFGDNHVLDDFSMTLHGGENLVVLGRSGSGKSVLIKCISGLMRADAGIIKVFGKRIDTMEHKELDRLRARIGFLFQYSALYDSMTVGENLAFPLRRHLRNKTKNEVQMLIEETLDNVGLRHTINLVPSELSGGMKKRIGLARSLILHPDLMLYDEPTAGLDPMTGKGISDLIVEMQRKYKTSSIIITHDVVCAEIVANRVIVLANGKCHAEGTLDELRLLNDPQVKGFF